MRALVERGLPDKQIVVDLQISVKTVESTSAPSSEDRRVQPYDAREQIGTASPVTRGNVVDFPTTG